MEQKLISVIVTVYNREAFLNECLTSLEHQTYKNFEAIIVDDGSTDESLEIIQTYTARDPRFILIASQHVGFPEAKNIGLQNAKGDYIIFLDSDDSAYPDWLKILYELCENTGADISTCLYDEYIEGKTGKAEEPNMKKYYGTGLPISEYQYLKMNLLFQYDCASYMWNKLIRKELYENIHFIDQIALSDISTMYKIFDKANKVVQVHLPLIHYRRHEEAMGSITSKEGVEYYKFRLTIIERLIEFIWNYYPQSRRGCQIAVQMELQRIQQHLTSEEFNQLDILNRFKFIKAFTLPYICKK